MISIRRYLILLISGGTGLLLTAGGVLAYRAMHAAVQAEFDYSLCTKADDFAALIEMEHDRYEIEFSDRRMPEFERKDKPEYFMVRQRSGEVIARSASLGSAELAFPDKIPAGHAESYGMVLPDGRAGRAAVVSMEIGGRLIDLTVARDTSHLNHLFVLMASGFCGAICLMLAVLAFGLNILVSRGLRPLDQFACQVVDIDSTHLDVRFAGEKLPAELQPVASQLDRMLDRIETALHRERYLTSAIAHELFTPIAELRSLTEVVLKWPDDTAAVLSLASQAHDIALQMQDVVNALLALSRCDAGLQRVCTAPVDLSGLIDKFRIRMDQKLLTKRIVAFWSITPGCIVHTDPGMLDVVLSNIFVNASEYVPIEGMFECRLDEQVGACVIMVSNTQQNLTTDDLPHLFEPMWRKDAARAGTFHSGLGLAVAKRFADLLKIKLTVVLPASGRFEIKAVIPGTFPVNV